MKHLFFSCLLFSIIVCVKISLAVHFLHVFSFVVDV